MLHKLSTLYNETQIKIQMQIAHACSTKLNLINNVNSQVHAKVYTSFLRPIDIELQN